MNFEMSVKIVDGKISSSQLDFLLTILQSTKKIKPTTALQHIQQKLKSEFDVEVSMDQLVDHFAVAIEQEDRELIYKNAGFV